MYTIQELKRKLRKYKMKELPIPQEYHEHIQYHFDRCDEIKNKIADIDSVGYDGYYWYVDGQRLTRTEYRKTEKHKRLKGLLRERKQHSRITTAIYKDFTFVNYG